ncbi:universal stress protein [uncultured Brevundimonas sp.]|uniref:universal stress protein n=1 Tax=uncultured Brevundimonas sp. TaxID=213418 RepID=UPI0030EEB106
MSYRSVMVYADEGLDSDTRVTLACDLATRFDAHLIGVSGSAPVPPPVGDPYMGGGVLGEALTLYLDLAESNVQRALTRFHEVVGGQFEDCEWRGRVGFPADILIAESRAADLVILGRRTDRTPFYTPDPADVLMGVGRPVLIVPPGSGRTPVDWPAVVAWSDSREARRAVAAALPMLRQTEKVHVVEICDGDETGDAQTRVDDVAAWLKRHDIDAVGEVSPRDHDSTAAAILEFTASRKAGLIVAGGYGHARIREWVLGGVTRDLLADSPVCLLLSH